MEKVCDNLLVLVCYRGQLLKHSSRFVSDGTGLCRKFDGTPSEPENNCVYTQLFHYFGKLDWESDLLSVPWDVLARWHYVRVEME